MNEPISGPAQGTGELPAQLPERWYGLQHLSPRPRSRTAAVPEPHQVEAEIEKGSPGDGRLEEDALPKADGPTEPSQPATPRDPERPSSIHQVEAVDEAAPPSTMDATKELIVARKFGTADRSLINEDRGNLLKIARVCVRRLGHTGRGSPPSQ